MLDKVRREFSQGPRLDTAEARALQEQPLETLEWFHAAHGDNFAVTEPGKCPRVFISNPDDMEEIFLAHGREFATAGSSLFKSLIGERALIFLSGQEHLDTRKLLGPPFLGGRMREFGPTIQAVTGSVLARVPRGESVPLIELTRQATLRLMLRVIFGPITTDLEDRGVRLCTDLINMVHGRPPRHLEGAGDPVAIVRMLLTALDGFIADEARRWRSEPDRGRTDVLDHLLETADRTGSGLTDREIRVHVVTLLIGGYESTSSALAWAAYLVFRHPVVRQRLGEELRSLGPTPLPDELPGLSYLDAVCHEVLRYASIVPTGIARTAPTDMHLAGHEFAAGTELVPCIHLAHRRASVFTEPTLFAPSRFLGVKYPATEYLPFGVGPRRCLGAVFAAYEMRIALATMLRTPGFRVLPTEAEVRAEAQGPTLTLPDSVLAVVDA